MIKAGEKAPQFSLPDQKNNKVSLKDLQGKWTVLYFYPKDNTSGCTVEATDFTKALKDFKRSGAEVIGVSPDSVESHAKFAQRHNLGVTLLSDLQRSVLEKYGAWGTKKLYGREFKGVVRSTVLIDPKGRVAHVWPKVKVKGHVDAVKSKLSELSK